MTKTVFFTLIIILLSLFSLNTADASILIDAFRHEENLCTNGCHQKFSYYSDDADEVCGNCHSYGLNVPALEVQHNPKTCIKCHPVSNKQGLHIVHKDINCSNKCHSLQGAKVLTPKVTYTDCKSCHTMKIHVLHQNKVKELCSTCHGSTVTAKMLPSTTSSAKFAFSTKTNYDKFTLYEMLKSLTDNFKEKKEISTPPNDKIITLRVGEEDEY